MATSEPAIDQSTRPQIPIGVDLSIGDACAIASGAALPHIAPEVGQRIAEAHERMRDCMLERRLVYGLHVNAEALMTCLVFDLAQSRHVHFVDAAGGGFAEAARGFKERSKSFAQPNS